MRNSSFSKIKIFSDKRYITEWRHRLRFLDIFWNSDSDHSYPPDPIWHTYYENAHQYFDWTSLEDCDVAIYPQGWNNPKPDPAAEEFIRRAIEHGKKIALFWITTSEESLNFQNTYLFKTNIRKSTRKPTEFIFPPLIADLLQEHIGETHYLEKIRQTPVVGFCGQIDNLTQNKKLFQAVEIHRRNLTDYFLDNPFLKRLGISITPHPGRYIGRRIRRRMIEAFMNTDLVQPNFIIRKKYNNGVDGLDSNHPLVRKSRQEFFNNIMESDYVLCPRGGENYSIRMFEVLCCGRIPVFINTDCVLPFEEYINWKDYCVWVEEDEINRLPEIISEFHRSHTPEDFLRLQRSCRKLWEDWLSPNGYFKNFYRHFR